jgi:hypothetical protein
MYTGYEKYCICDKPLRKHTKRCDAHRLSEFEKKCSKLDFNNAYIGIKFRVGGHKGKAWSPNIDGVCYQKGGSF